MNARIAGVVVLLSSGCLAPERAPRESAGDSEGGSQGETAEADDSGLDADAVMERAFAYKTELVQVNAMPEPGTHGDAADVNYFSAPENEQLFRTIDPTLDDQQVSFIEGALFVKEHLGPDGAVIGFTVMQKAKPGYNPEAGDWWFARVSEDNVTHQGKVGFCMDCHVMVENTDFIYGVPLDNRM